jgi:hypothetical protein
VNGRGRQTDQWRRETPVLCRESRVVQLRTITSPITLLPGHLVGSGEPFHIAQIEAVTMLLDDTIGKN